MALVKKCTLFVKNATFQSPKKVILLQNRTIVLEKGTIVRFFNAFFAVIRKETMRKFFTQISASEFRCNEFSSMC